MLVLAFVIVGVVVYQATAPPPGPNERSFSFSKIMDHIRREVRGNRASTEMVSTSTRAIDDDVTELRIIGHLNGEIQISGEDRADIETSLQVRSNAYNDAEAKQYANETILTSDRAAASLVLSVKYPREGRQRASLTVKIPSRLRVRVESRPATLMITNVSGVEATNAGDTTIRNAEGRVALTLRGGHAVVDGAGTLKLTARGGDVEVTDIRGDVSIMIEQGAELTASKLAGPLDVDARNAEVTFDNLEPTRGPIRINVVNGSATLKGVKADTRVDGRNSELDIVMSAAAPIAIYTEGEDVAVTPPPGGYRLDALVVEGRVAPEALLDELGLQHATDPETKESRASGAVTGGGPTITVRATRGDLTLRTPDKLSR
ncbi:MAG: hypothetical protein ACREIT_09075 [Tepidisphaeraceae bacterium]